MLSLSLASASFTLSPAAALRIYYMPPVRALTMQEPGTQANPEQLNWDNRVWSKRDDSQTTDDGACFVISENEAPEYDAVIEPMHTHRTPCQLRA